MFFLVVISFLTLLGVSALLLPVIIRGRIAPLPWSFLATQLALALLARPLIDLATFIWHLLPVYAILYSLPSFAASIFESLVYASASTFFTNVFSDLVTVFNSLAGHIAFFSPFDIKENVKEAWYSVVTSVDDFRTNANFSEILQHLVIYNELPPVQSPVDAFWNSFEGTAKMHGYPNLKREHLLENLTISDQTQQYLDAINVAVVGFFENAQVKDIFKVTRLPSSLNSSLSRVTESLYLFAKELNFTEMLNNGTFPSNATDHWDAAERALSDVIVGTDPKELYESTILMPAQALNLNSSEEVLVLSMLRDPVKFIVSSSSEHLNKSMPVPWKEIVSNFIAFAWRDIVKVNLLLFVVIPLVFILRAALQDGCLWLVTRRYKFVIPFEQRSASGWMSAAAISGLAMAVTEAFAFCCIILYHEIPEKHQSLWVFGFHGLKGAPLRAAAHMRLAEAFAEVDMLKSGESGFRRGMIVSALVNGAFSMWWIFAFVAFMLYPVIGRLALVPVLADIVFVCYSIGWGRRICRRLVEKEQRVFEERGRKDD